MPLGLYIYEKYAHTQKTRGQFVRYTDCCFVALFCCSITLHSHQFVVPDFGLLKFLITFIYPLTLVLSKHGCECGKYVVFVCVSVCLRVNRRIQSMFVCMEFSKRGCLRRNVNIEHTKLSLFDQMIHNYICNTHKKYTIHKTLPETHGSVKSRTQLCAIILYIINIYGKNRNVVQTKTKCISSCRQRETRTLHCC